VLDYTSDFTVSSAGDTGTLTRVGTWTADAIRLTIYRDIALVQETDYRNGDVIDADAVERSIDRLTALAQQINEIAGRQISIPITDTSATLELPSVEERKEKILGFDVDGNAIAASGSAPVPASSWVATNILPLTSSNGLLSAGGGTTVGKSMFTASDKAAQQSLIAGTVGKAALDAVADTIVTGFKSAKAGDADTVSGYGIGVVTAVSVGSGSALDAISKGGDYVCTNPTGLPANTYAMNVLPLASNIWIQTVRVFDTTRTHQRSVLNNTPGAWYEVFNALSDGNGGQPPAPKPVYGSSPAGGANYPGQIVQGPGTDNTAWTLPAGGSWLCVAYATNASGAFYTGVSAANIQYAPGGTTILSAASGKYNAGWAWRVL